MVCGFFVGLATSVVPVLQISDYGLRLMVTTAITAVVWVVVMLLTPPESAEVLEAVRPARSAPWAWLESLAAAL